MPFWKNELQKARLQLKDKKNGNPRIAILGIGSELNGDDAAGVFIARELRQVFAERPPRDDLVIYDCGTLPENFSGPLRKFAPDMVLILDAGSFDEAPGQVRLTTTDDIDGLSFSTHSLPPSIFAKFLTEELDCVVLLLLIQAENVDFCAPLNNQVELAVQETVRELAHFLQG